MTLSRSFEIATTEITEGAYRAVTGQGGGSQLPVSSVNWHELAAYCNALSQSEAGPPLESCYACTGSGPSVRCDQKEKFRGASLYDCPGFRLMTEAEFERAARAGSSTDTYLGDFPDPVSCDWGAAPTPRNAALLDRLGIYRGNSGDGRHPVASRPANPWGIHDLYGNVWERTNDLTLPDLGDQAVTDPWGASSGSDNRQRGGSFHYMARYMRAGDRGNQNSTRDERSVASGGRCVRSLPDE